MGHGGYLQIYNGTPYKWVRDRIVSSVQMEQWNDVFPMEVLPNTKHLIYVEYKWTYLTNLKKTIAKVKYTFEQHNVENTPSDPQSVTKLAPPVPVDMWVKFKAIASPDFDLFAIFSDNVHMLKMNDIPSTILFPTPPEYQLTSENDNDHLCYQEPIGWYHNDIVYFYLTQSQFVPNHFQTSLKLPRHHDFSPKNWMTQYFNDLENVPLKNLAIPGSHDSGMYAITSRTIGGTSGNTITQRLSIHQQLTSGCRYFDLRPALWKNTYYMGHYGKISDRQALGTNGASFDTMIDDFNRFTTEANPDTGATLNNELIIIVLSHDFNTNDGYRNLNQGEWDNLFTLFKDNLKFMRTDLLDVIPSSFSNATLGQFLTKPTTQFANEDLYGSDSQQVITQPFQPCVLVLVEPSEAAVPERSGLYSCGARTMDFHDKYSETLLPSKMMPDQLTHLISRSTSMAARQNMFILNWILTQDQSTATWCAFGLGKGECDLLSLAENVNPVLEHDMMLLALHYESEWVNARDRYLTMQADGNHDGEMDRVKPTFQPQATQLETYLPNHASPNPFTPNIIFVDGFSPLITQLAVGINLFHYARVKLTEIYRKTPTTSQSDPVEETDYELHPFAIPPVDTEFSMYIPPSKDEDEDDEDGEGDLDDAKDDDVRVVAVADQLASQDGTKPTKKVKTLLQKLQFDVPADKVQQELENDSVEKSLFRDKSVLRVLQRDSSEDETANDTTPKHGGNLRESNGSEREDSYVYDEDDEEANRVNDKLSDDDDDESKGAVVQAPALDHINESDSSDDDIPAPTELLERLASISVPAQSIQNGTVVQQDQDHGLDPNLSSRDAIINEQEQQEDQVEDAKLTVVDTASIPPQDLVSGLATPNIARPASYNAFEDDDVPARDTNHLLSSQSNLNDIPVADDEYNAFEDSPQLQCGNLQQSGHQDNGSDEIKTDLDNLADREVTGVSFDFFSTPNPERMTQGGSLAVENDEAVDLDDITPEMARPEDDDVKVTTSQYLEDKISEEVEEESVVEEPAVEPIVEEPTVVEQFEVEQPIVETAHEQPVVADEIEEAAQEPESAQLDNDDDADHANDAPAASAKANGKKKAKKVVKVVKKKK